MAAIGVRPRVELAKAAGLAIGETGAIAVDGGMRASRSEAFAAGDCAEARHIVSGKPVWVPLGDIANRQGRVAGVNIADGAERFPGVLGTAIFKVFDLAVARTGLGPEQARAAGFDPVVVRASARSRARYIPGSGPVEAMLVATARPEGFWAPRRTARISSTNTSMSSPPRSGLAFAPMILRTSILPTRLRSRRCSPRRRSWAN